MGGRGDVFAAQHMLQRGQQVGGGIDKGSVQIENYARALILHHADLAQAGAGGKGEKRRAGRIYGFESPIQNFSLFLLVFFGSLSAQTGPQGTPAPFCADLLDSEPEKAQ
jgi:hypothetical protein